jgi:hypothetical protein
MKRLLYSLAAVAFGATSSSAVQNELVPPMTGIFTGPQYSQKIGDAFRSLASCQKGSVAPANVGGSTVDGLCWIDDSASPWVLKRYVNGGWAIEAAFDPSTSSYVGVIGGGLGSIASASTTDLNSVPQANVTITGTTTIASFGSASPAGIEKTIRFSGALTLTNSSSLTVPGGFDLTTATNDRAKVTHLGSGNWEITQYTRASGIPIDVAAVGKPDFTFSVSVPPLHVAGYGQALTRTSYPAYLAKVTRAQNGTRISGNATITGIADTSGFGPGMPAESTGVTAGCTIASLVANTSITLNSSSCVTASGTSTVTVFPYGYGSGGSATTVGVPDCRGRAFAGRDRNDPGSLANRLTSSYFGADSSIYGVSGSSSESTQLTASLIPDVISKNTGSISLSVSSVGTGGGTGSFVVTDTGGIQSSNAPGGSLRQLSAAALTGALASNGTLAINAVSVTTNGTGGTNPAHRTVAPELIAECVVRVVP